MVSSFEDLYFSELRGRMPARAHEARRRESDMCGIAGRFNYDSLRPVDRDVLDAMTDAVAHRGPDAAGYYLGPGIGLGHRRLSIIDLSTGDQPLANEDGTVLGRLQRRDLQLRRGPRRARSRTAIGSAPAPTPKSSSTATKQWGERCVERFRGMFAFAVWDAPRAPAAARARSRSASSRSTTPSSLAGASCSARRSSRCSRIPTCRATGVPRRSTRTSTLLYIPAPDDDLPRRPQARRRATCSSPRRGARPRVALLGPARSPATATRRAKTNTSNSSTRCSPNRSRCG